MKKVLRFRVAASAVFLLCMATAIAMPAQNFKTLVSFDGSNGAHPTYGLVQGFDGIFYGTTYEGGIYQYGTAFRIGSQGTFLSLHSFCTQNPPYCPDGAQPNAGLVQALDGNFYGTTSDNNGTVFRLAPGGGFTILHSFNYSDGAGPISALFQASDGNFYGTTNLGGAYYYGTVFKLTPAGTLTTLHSFDSTDGAYPIAGLIQARDGNFYGTTSSGGNSNGTYCPLGCGTVFQITPSGTLTTLYSFCPQAICTDGFLPLGLVQATDGSPYGITTNGGTIGYGTVFKISLGGTFTTLHSFDLSDGANPNAGLIQATDGNFYGTTTQGGASYTSCSLGCGTVFKVTSGGDVTTLHSFDSADGSFPLAALLQATDGSFYGTTGEGGVYSDGTVFSLSVGFGPFVETLPTSGKVGSKVIILGNALTGTNSVTFNGTAATFTVASPTEIKTTVPTGATSGKVQVTTPHGTLSSNVVFRVK
jgi:uncharacterized repeat protein (TIGR03803 family)